MLTLVDTYGDFSVFASQESLNNVIYYKKASIKNSYYFDTKAFDTKEGNSEYTYAKLKNQYIPNLTGDSTTPQSFINSIEINQYIQMLENMVDYGSNIIYNTLDEILKEIDHQKDVLVENSKNLSEQSKLGMLTAIANIKELSTDFKQLVDGLTSNNVIYVVHTTKDYSKFADYHEVLLKDYEKVDQSSTEIN